MTSKITHYKEELNRTIDWLKFAEQKLAFLGVYYGLGTTFLFANNTKIVALLSDLNCYKIAVLLGFFISMFVGVFFLFRVIFPVLNNLSTNNSYFFFGHIAKMKVLDFISQMKNLSDDEITEQLLEQIHTNSVITDAKMVNIKKSSYCLFVNLFFLFLLIPLV